MRVMVDTRKWGYQAAGESLAGPATAPAVAAAVGAVLVLVLVPPLRLFESRLRASDDIIGRE